MCKSNSEARTKSAIGERTALAVIGSIIILTVRKAYNSIYTIGLNGGRHNSMVKLLGASPDRPLAFHRRCYVSIEGLDIFRVFNELPGGFELFLAVRGTDNGIYFAYIPMGYLPIP